MPAKPYRRGKQAATLRQTASPPGDAAPPANSRMCRAAAAGPELRPRPAVGPTLPARSRRRPRREWHQRPRRTFPDLALIAPAEAFLKKTRRGKPIGLPFKSEPPSRRVELALIG